MSHDPSEPGVPKPNDTFLALPGGAFISLDDLHRLEKLHPQAEISTNVLRAGDLVAMQYMEGDQDTAEQERGMLFEITGSRIEGVQSGEPETVLTGTLSGAGLPDIFHDREVRFIGNGWGGTTVNPGIIKTGRSQYFHLFGGQGEYRSPDIHNFEVFRPDSNGDYQAVEPQALEAFNPEIAAIQEKRLEQVQNLMNTMGYAYDFVGANADPHNQNRIENNDVVVSFQAGGVTGNILGVFDKRTRQFTQYQYFKNSDTLRVVTADLDGVSLHEYDERSLPTDFSAAYRAKAPVTVMTTSPRIGVDAVAYRMSSKDASEELGIQVVSTEELYVPDITFQPDGTMDLDVSQYPFTLVDDQFPGSNDKIRSRVAGGTNRQGKHFIKIGNKTVVLKTDDEIFKTAQKSAERIGKTRKTGRFIGRTLRRRTN